MWKRICTRVCTYWERALFIVIALCLFAWCGRLLYLGNVAEASAVFGMGFLSAIYANVARFKRFKGLGFEAELWEDKQKEAADLIERLRGIVEIYSREIVLGRVTAMRFSDTRWEDHWALYKEITDQHDILGQKIDFSELKNEIDNYFLFDMVNCIINDIRSATSSAKNSAQAPIETRRMNKSIEDSEYYMKLKIIDSIDLYTKYDFEYGTNNNLAKLVIDTFNENKLKLKIHFDIDLECNPDHMNRLEKISELYKSRPVLVTKELIELTRRDGDF